MTDISCKYNVVRINKTEIRKIVKKSHEDQWLIGIGYSKLYGISITMEDKLLNISNKQKSKLLLRFYNKNLRTS